MKTDLGHDKIFGLEVWMIKILAVPLVMTAGFLASLFLVLIPKVTEVNGYRLQIRQNQERTKQVKQKTSYLITIDQDEVKKNAEQLSMALLGNKDAYFLVNVIRDAAKPFDFRVESFSITPGQLGDTSDDVAATSKKPAAKLGLESVPVNILLVGPEDRYVNLIAALERSLPIMSVDKVETNVKTGAAELSMTISTFFSPDPKDFKINALSLADLTLKDDEMKLIEELGQYQKIAGVSADEGGLMKKGDFQKFDRKEPFGM